MLDLSKTYGVFECRKTYQLWCATQEAFSSYIPLERYYDSEGVVRERPAIYGVVFVKFKYCADFRRHVTEDYNVKQLHYPFTLQPKLVDVKDLTRVQEFLNHEFEGHSLEPVEPEQPEVVYRYQDKVRVIKGLAGIVGMEGVVQRCKSGGRARVRMAETGLMLEINCDWLEKL